MKEIVDVISTIGGKVSLSVGTLAGLVFAIFKINTCMDKRIDKRSETIAENAITKHHDECSLKINENIATITADMGWVKDSLNKIEKKL